MMNENLLSLERWDALTPLECEAVAREASRLMPPPWQFTEVRLCRGGQNSHYIAFFNWNGTAFALIPGGEATLGYDRDNPFLMDEAKYVDWQKTMALCYGIPEFDEYMDEVMTPLRTVTIEPFLIEVEAKELKLITIELVNSIYPKITTEIEAYKAYPVSHRQTQQLISQDWFRFPTSDEWEYACAAGTRTLWHWGNEYPLHCYPNECKDWNLNIKPNAFGLYIATYPYDWEFCTESEIRRGGDCGNASEPTLGWFSLASSFFELELEDNTHSISVRRVCSIPPDPD